MKQKRKEEIGPRLKILRESMGLTQTDMVKFLNICRPNYSRIERGQIAPNPHIMAIIKAEFNVSLDWLITGEGEMHPPKRTKPIQDMDFAKCGKELDELFEYMHKVPMVKHAMLGFFLEYSLRHRNLIEELFKKLEQLKEDKKKENET